MVISVFKIAGKCVNMVRVIHNNCGKLAFYFKVRLKEGSIIFANNIVLIDGSEAVSGDQIICGSCGDPLVLNPYTVTIEEEDWTDWFINDEVRNNNLNASVAPMDKSS